MSAAPDYPPGWPSPSGQPAPSNLPDWPGRPARSSRPAAPGQAAPSDQPAARGQAAPSDQPAARGQAAGPRAGLGALLAAAGTAVADLADGADLGQMADRDAVAVMGTLTTLVGRLDGLRVRVAREVRDRDICGLRGRRTLAGWLHADARLADDARKLARLAAMGPGLPKITALLDSGTIGLTQAATACWQISQLPHLPVPPDTLPPPDSPDPAVDPGADGGAEGAGQGPDDSDPQTGPHDTNIDTDTDTDTDGARDGDAGSPGDGDAQAGPRDGDAGSPGDGDAQAGPRDGDGEPGGGGDVWAGLWRAGDVRAAADELFAAFLPGLDGDQLRQLGGHLREAADSQQQAGDASDDYHRRGLRISRSLGGAGEISGRLHAEAAEQVIAAFEELGAKTGPDDKRTRAQRWADVLTRLAALAGPHPASAPPAGSAAVTAPDPASTPAAPSAGPADADDDQPCDADSPSGHHHRGQEPDPDTGHDHHGQEPDPDTGHDHHGQEPDSSREPDHGADGLHDNGTESSRPGGTVPAAYRRPRIIVTVPLSTLLREPLAPGASIGPGAPLTAEAARRLACDAEIIRLITHPPDRPAGMDGTGLDATGLDATGRLTRRLAAAIAQLPPPLATPSAVLDIGRKSPGWTPRQRDALHAQYGGHCAAPRCTGPIDVIHHILHWLFGGKTRIANGCPFCDYHHWLVHEGGWQVRKHPDATITLHPPPPGWKPGTIYRHGRPLTE